MDFVKEIEYYCKQENTSGALLVNGNWGSGKTYFFEKTLPKLSWFCSNTSIISISLFGITSREILDKKLKEKYILKNLSIPEISTVKKGIISNIIYSITKFFTGTDIKLTEKEISLKSLLGAAQVFTGSWDSLVQIPRRDKFGEVILIFDDLERCPMEMEELLGAINAYVEGSKIKTILIANEDYIKEKEKTDKTYSTMKEKLVCRTIKYKPDFINIVEKVIEDYITLDYNYISFLKTQEDFLAQFLQKHKNIRVLKSAIQDFERFYRVIISENIDVRCYGDIFSDYLSIVTEFILKDTDKEATKYQTESLEEYAFRTTVTFQYNAMKLWNEKGIWDPNMFRQQLSIYKNNLPELVLLRTNNLLKLNDQIWEDGIDKLLNMAYHGELDVYGYFLFFVLLINACKLDINITLNVSKLSNALKEKINCFKSRKSNDVLSPDTKFNDEDKQVLEQHFPHILPILDMIEQLDNRTYQEKNRDLYIEELQDDNHDKIQEHIGIYPLILDQKLANAIGDYWNKLHEKCARNNFMEKFISSFKGIETFPDLDQTFKGIDTLTELLSKLTSGPISTAQNREFEKRLLRIKKYLKKHFGVNLEAQTND